MNISTKFFGTLLVLFALSGFVINNHAVYLEKEVIEFTKKQLGKKAKYSIHIPKSDSIKSQLIQTIGGHGHGFQFTYSDSSIIYFSNDWAIMTPNYDNYDQMDLNSLGKRLIDIDTIMSGVQNNGLNWKEIIKNKRFIGYLNVTNSNKDLYDKSISSFTKK